MSACSGCCQEADIDCVLFVTDGVRLDRSELSERWKRGSAREHLVPVQRQDSTVMDSRDRVPGNGGSGQPTLHERRLVAVTNLLVAERAACIADLGCGTGRLAQRLLAERSVAHVLAVDRSPDVLRQAAERLGLDRMTGAERRRISLQRRSLHELAGRLARFDAVVAVEVIEHLDPEGLDLAERVLLGDGSAPLIVVTTPNREYNVHLGKLRRGLRHDDHRFEWTRAEFAEWVRAVAAEHGYRWEVRGVGPDDAATGPPSQMAVFRR